MPVHRVSGGWRWGNHGHVYSTRDQALAQARAAYAHGYHGSEYNAGMLSFEEKGLVWSERRSDGTMYARGSGGQYQIVPRGGKYRGWWLGNDGAHVDLGAYGTLGAATQAAARFDPATGQMAAEARYDTKRWAVFFDGPQGPDVIEVDAEDANSAAAKAQAAGAGRIKRVRPVGGASEAAEECSCAHAHPPGVPTTPCAMHPAMAAEEGRTANVLYESRGVTAETPAKPLRWHRTKKGYEAKGRMGDYEVVQRKADRRHGIEPVALLISTVRGPETLRQFGAVGEAKAFAQRYDEVAPYALRRGQNDTAWPSYEAGEASAPKQPQTSVRVPLNVDTRGAHVDGTLKLGGGSGVGPAIPNAMYEAPRKKGESGPAADGVRTFSRHIEWNRSPRGWVGEGKISGAIYKVDSHGIPHARQPAGAKIVWTLMQNGVEDARFFYDEAQAMVAADYMEAHAGGIPESAESSGAREAPGSAVPIDKPGDAPLVTLQRDFKKYAACSKASASIGPIDGPKQIWKLLAKTMLRETQEVFIVVCLNIHDRLTTCPVEVARGAHSRVEVDPAIVVQAALAGNADSFIVCHQHPGSRPDPSDADVRLTETIQKAADAVGGKTHNEKSSLEFRDHYVVSDKGVYSIKNRKLWRA